VGKLLITRFTVKTFNGKRFSSTDFDQDHVTEKHYKVDFSALIVNKQLTIISFSRDRRQFSLFNNKKVNLKQSLIIVSLLTGL